ncbi:MAG: DUF6020 family protein [Lachnospiraceae bacterium]|nr:DUF6020 family protein [Lachnospiraceae bacterium]
MKKGKLNYIKLVVLPIFSAIGITCATNMDAQHITNMGMEGYPALAVILEKSRRSMSSDRLLLLLLALLTGMLILSAEKKAFEKRDRILAAIFAVGFSGTQLLCKSYEECNSWSMLLGGKFAFLRAMVIILGTAVLIYYLILLSFYYLDRISPKATGEKGAFSRKYYITASLLVLLCWIPYFILFFPGTSSTDTASQIAQFFGQPTWTRNMSSVRGDDIYLSNHFPFFTTVLIGSFVKLGVMMGKAAYGVALYVFLQMMFMAFVLTGVWFYLRWAGLSQRCLKAGLVFTAIFPLYPMDAVCVLKDVSFSVFCLIMSVLLFEIVRSRGEALKKKSFCAALLLDTFLVILFRSQGVYIMILVALVVLVVYRRYWLQAAASLLLPILVFQLVWVKILLPMWNVAPSGRQEAIGILFQQTARYVSEYPEDVTEEEKEVIDKVIAYDLLAEKYNPTLTDPVKFTFRQDCTTEELLEYLKVWLSMLKRHPGTYVEAVLNNCYGFFYLGHSSGLVYKSYVNKDRWKEGSALHVELPLQTDPVEKTVSVLPFFLQKIPVIGLLFSIGAYSWLVIYFAFNTIRKKKYSYLIPGMVTILSTGIFLICPANGNFRYVMPLIFAAPFLLGMCIFESASGAKRR